MLSVENIVNDHGKKCHETTHWEHSKKIEWK